MAHSYPIWMDVTSCIYNSSKSYGVRQNGLTNIKVGTSASNSHHFAQVEVKCRILNGNPQHRVFKLYVDGVKIKEAAVIDGEYTCTYDMSQQTVINN